MLVWNSEEEKNKMDFTHSAFAMMLPDGERIDVETVVTRFPLSFVLQFTFSPDRCCFHTEPGKNMFINTSQDLV